VFRRLLSLLAKMLAKRDNPVEPHRLITLADPVPENWHESFIEHLAYVIRPKVYVELGLYRCTLFNRIIPYAEQLIGVDIDPEAGNWMIKSDKVKFVNCSTDDFAAQLRANPPSIDVLFIDADHSKEAVLRDFWNFFPFVSPHGIILLHDTHPKNVEYMLPRYCNNAYEAAEELSKSAEKFEMMSLPVHPGLTLCRKRTVQLSWMETGSLIVFEPR
jgi:predicted O-methyltransferase YrrM